MKIGDKVYIKPCLQEGDIFRLEYFSIRVNKEMLEYRGTWQTIHTIQSNGTLFLYPCGFLWHRDMVILEDEEFKKCDICKYNKIPSKKEIYSKNKNKSFRNSKKGE